MCFECYYVKAVIGNGAVQQAGTCRLEVCVGFVFYTCGGREIKHKILSDQMTTIRFSLKKQNKWNFPLLLKIQNVFDMSHNFNRKYYYYIHSLYLLFITADWNKTVLFIHFLTFISLILTDDRGKKHSHLFLITYHSRVAGVECGLEALLFSFSSSVTYSTFRILYITDTIMCKTLTFLKTI